MQEPKDGDFAAYVEALQRESAQRLARTHGSPGSTAFPAAGSPPGTAGEAASAPAPVAGPANDPARRDRDAQLVRALVAGVVGGALLLSWMGDGGPFAFVVGVALLAYALRLFSRARGRSLSNKAMVDQVFGRSATPSKGSRK